MKKFFLIIILLIAVGAAWYVLNRTNSPDAYSTKNIILGIRGFNHPQLFAAGGEAKQYDVRMGEEFKVLWIIHELTSDGHVTWHGPTGVGQGSVALHAPAQELTEVRVFTATEPGTAEFILTATGPDSSAETNTITVRIK